MAIGQNPKENTFLKIDLPSDIERLYNAGQKLKELKSKLTPDLQADLEDIITILRLPEDTVIIKIDLKKDIQRMAAAKEKLLALKDKVDQALQAEIEAIAKDIH